MIGVEKPERQRKGSSEDANTKASQTLRVTGRLFETLGPGCRVYLPQPYLPRVVPIMLSLPAMLSPVPPLMITIPTILPFGIQIPSPVFRLAAVFSLVMDCFVQSSLGFLDGVLALRPIIGMDAGRCYK